MNIDPAIKDAFLRELLDDHGIYVTDLLAEGIDRLKLTDTGELLASLKYSVVKQGNNYVLRFSFLGYGRAIEIEYFKSRRLRRAAKRKGVVPAKKQKRKKDTRFYSKPAFGSVNRLASRMMYGLTDAEIDRLKSKLQPD